MRRARIDREIKQAFSEENLERYTEREFLQSHHDMRFITMKKVKMANATRPTQKRGMSVNMASI